MLKGYNKNASFCLWLLNSFIFFFLFFFFLSFLISSFLFFFRYFCGLENKNNKKEDVKSEKRKNERKETFRIVGFCNLHLIWNERQIGVQITESATPPIRCQTKSCFANQNRYLYANLSFVDVVSSLQIYPKIHNFVYFFEDLKRKNLIWK